MRHIDRKYKFFKTTQNILKIKTENKLAGHSKTFQ